MLLKPFISCLHPERIFNRNTRSWEYVPCGKCAACVNRSNAVMSNRINAECKAHKYTFFFTLTYDNAHIPLMEYFEDKCSHAQFRPYGRVAADDRYFKSLPVFPFWSYTAPNSKFNSAGVSGQEVDLPLPPVSHYDGNNTVFAVSCKQDVIDFIKRLRQKIYKKYGNKCPFKYYFCSEYGPKTYRPHYHGLLFFNSKELSVEIADLVQQSWGLFRRIQGHGRNRFTFDPFCSPDRFTLEGRDRTDDYNMSFVTGDANAASNYVSTYVTSATNLPKVLLSKSFAPFRLYSASSMFGVTDDVSSSVFSHFAHLYDTRNCYTASSGRSFTHRLDSVDKDGHPCVLDIPYTQHELLSVWRKPFQYSLLSDPKKCCTFAFVYRHSRELIEKMIPRRLWKSYLKSHYPSEFDVFGMDEQQNWIASTRAYQFCSSRHIDVVYYARVYDYMLYLSQQYKLKRFYELQQLFISFTHSPASVLHAYPFVLEDLPLVFTDATSWDSPAISFAVSLGIDLADLYPDGYHLDTKFVESLDYRHNQVYTTYKTDQLTLAFKHEKGKYKESCLFV